MTLKKIIVSFFFLSVAFGSVFPQENSSKKIVLGLSSLYPENQKNNREFLVLGEYYFGKAVGIGIKGAFEEGDVAQRDNNYFIYGTVKTPISKENDFVILKPSGGAGYAEGIKKMVFNIAIDIDFYLIKNLLYSGIVSSTNIIPGSGTKVYTGINLGVCL